MRAAPILIGLAAAGAVAAPAPVHEGKSVVVDKSKFAEIYPAVWLSPSTGEILALKKLSELPPEAKYEIWIEPRDPEFSYVDQANKEVGFVLLGKGEQVFNVPDVPKKPKLTHKLMDLMKESQGKEKLVFYCKGKKSESLIMVTGLDSAKQTFHFKWRLLRK